MPIKHETISRRRSMFAHILYAVCFTLLFLITGCDLDELSGSNTEQLGAHKVKIERCGMFTNKTNMVDPAENRYTFACGKTNVEIKDDELIVNDKRLGKLSGKSSVIIAEDYTVWINGSPTVTAAPLAARN